MAETSEDPIETAWQTLLDDWEDESAHKKFLLLCQATDQLGEAGKRYRAVKDADDERAPLAEAQIEKVLGLAMANLADLKTEPPKQGAKSIMFLIAFAVSATLIVSALWAMLRSF